MVKLSIIGLKVIGSVLRAVLKSFGVTVIEYYISKDLCWFRLFGVGALVKKTAPLFSERYGYIKTYPLPVGEWRVQFLNS